MEKTKATFALEQRTKDKLEALKVRLRRAGIARSKASESAIIESLIHNCDFDELLAEFTE